MVKSIEAPRPEKSLKDEMRRINAEVDAGLWELARSLNKSGITDMAAVYDGRSRGKLMYLFEERKDRDGR